jgi:uncharacterized protein (DUF3820 family)/uncharacterized C2H2 Zn-finger protein
MPITKIDPKHRGESLRPGDTTFEFKCLRCEFVCNNKAQMIHHQTHEHQWVFRPDMEPKLVDQMGHIYWHVKVLEYDGMVIEVRARRMNPNEEKLPTGNLTEDSLMPFGKHKGTKMSDMSTRYLHWLYTATEKKAFNRGVFVYIKKNMEKLQAKHPELDWDPRSKPKK